MLQTLRAFAWLRWRMFVNSLERTGARDTVERFSIAIENLGPIMAAVLMIPSALALAALGVASGLALAGGNGQSILFSIVRFTLLAVPILCIVGPLILPAADRANPVRLLLLPISRGTLYVAQSASALGDPWVVLMVPLVAGMPVGLALGGAPAAALVALVAGAVLIVTVVGISALATSLLHLAVRDRRRGELLALIFIIILPVLGMLPGIMGSGRTRDAEGRRVRRPAAERVLPPWVQTAGERAFAALPSELYAASTRTAAERRAVAAAAPLLALGALTALLHLAGRFVFGRVLDSPGSTGSRRVARASAMWGRTLPFLGPAASAVALAQVRLALRTPRGRSTMLSPLIMFGVFGVMMQRQGGNMDFGPFSFQSGIGLAAFSSFVSLISILPIAMNQFAVDRAGLTLALLSPLGERDYLKGKAVGNGLIVAGPALLCVLVSAILFPGGSPALWVSIPLSLLAIYFIVAPAAAMFSAIFPRVVDMNSIGRGSNAHGLAGLLGLFVFVASGLPCVLLILLATRWFERPSLAPLFLLAWCAITYGIGLLLAAPARAIFISRRDNLTLIQ